MDSHEESGIIIAILRRLETQRIPRLLDIREKVFAGDRLDDFDIEYLERVLDDALSNESIVVGHPELNPLIAGMNHLYKEITEQALANERDFAGQDSELTYPSTPAN